MGTFGEAVPALLRWLEESYPSGAEKMSPAELLAAATTWCSERGLPQPGKVILASVLKGLPGRVTAGRGRMGRWYQLASMAGLQGSEEGLALLLEAGAEPVVETAVDASPAPQQEVMEAVAHQAEDIVEAVPEAEPEPEPELAILVSAPRPRPATVKVPVPLPNGGVAGTPVEEATDEKKAEAAVAYAEQLRRTNQDNDDPLAYMPLSAIGKVPADSTTYPNRPAVQLQIKGREGEPWRLVATRRGNVMTTDGERVAICARDLVRIEEPVSSLDAAAASLAKTLNGVVTNYQEPPELVGATVD